ncbi:hypothetical protein PYW07_009973 [Mythimna separata]|uniref:Uncharacterized protein n=1 Tax=Mythimna separata TaxID=271217 RepID=A0AAD7YI64_MYTSE|nr:hypothetical protein PYW07_009973 [Mythimna separata]
MGSDGDNLQSSIAHIVLCAVAGRGISRMTSATYTHPGMHANFFIHGVIGFFHYQSGILGDDLRVAYFISLKAVRYLALPCLNADLRRSDTVVSAVHVLTGLIPFALAVFDTDNVPLGNVCLALNILSLCHYSHTMNREFGWYTAGAACLAYFVVPQTGQRFLYPLALALMEYFAYRVWHSHYDPPPFFPVLGGRGGGGGGGAIKKGPAK